MNYLIRTFLSLGALAIFFQTAPITVTYASVPAEKKEWTFLVFLNGNNNLDSFGALNINQMEKVGSTKDINVVVQWASLANKKTQRLLITKDNDPKKVTSPVLQDMGDVDMGDWRSLVEFIRWGAANFPAKHYFVDIWDHGSGWHALASARHTRSLKHITDISWDDNTGNSITTEQLGQALTEGAAIIGHKIDLYASDACLMAMAEVATQLADGVEFFAGSEEVEPGAGWPYDTFLSRWATLKNATAKDVGVALTEEYVNSYNGGQNGKQDVTFSLFDLKQLPRFQASVRLLQQNVIKMSSDQKALIVKAIQDTQNFSYSDYGDFGDFIQNLSSSGSTGLPSPLLTNITRALGDLVVLNRTSPYFNRSKGMSIWLPKTRSSLDYYSDRYQKLKFHEATLWGDALKALLST